MYIALFKCGEDGCWITQSVEKTSRNNNKSFGKAYGVDRKLGVDHWFSARCFDDGNNARGFGLSLDDLGGVADDDVGDFDENRDVVEDENLLHLRIQQALDIDVLVLLLFFLGWFTSKCRCLCSCWDRSKSSASVSHMSSQIINKPTFKLGPTSILVDRSHPSRGFPPFVEASTNSSVVRAIMAVAAPETSASCRVYDFDSSSSTKSYELQ